MKLPRSTERSLTTHRVGFSEGGCGIRTSSTKQIGSTLHRKKLRLSESDRFLALRTNAKTIQIQNVFPYLILLCTKKSIYLSINSNFTPPPYMISL